MDLRLVASEDLLRELESRHDAGVFILEQQRSKAGGEDEDYRVFRWWGGLSTALGLTMMLQRGLVDEWLDDEGDNAAGSVEF